MKLKIALIGNSYDVILPEEVLAKLRVSGGDVVSMTETATGFIMTPYDPEFEQDMKLAKHFMKKRRNVLRNLAKE